MLIMFYSFICLSDRITHVKCTIITIKRTQTLFNLLGYIFPIYQTILRRVREIEGMGMEFVQGQLGITLYTKFKVNLLIANTQKIIAYINVHQNVTTGIMVELPPRSTFSSKSTLCHPVTQISVLIFMKNQENIPFSVTKILELKFEENPILIGTSFQRRYSLNHYKRKTILKI